MKKNWIWIVLAVLIVAALGYLGRNQIKSTLGMSDQTSATISASPTPTPKLNTPTAKANISSIKTHATKGKYLATFAGITLYIFDKDTKGISNCYGTCATTWPPYTSGAMISESSLPTDITTIKRTDGTIQFAWKGIPLYYYAKDLKPGDILGDGVGGIWHIVNPQ